MLAAADRVRGDNEYQSVGAAEGITLFVGVSDGFDCSLERPRHAS